MPETKQKKRQDDNTLARLRQFLVQAGIPAGQFHDLLDKAIRLNYTDSEFILSVYGSPQFKHMFPGIFRPDGSMRMTPYEYRQMEDQYQSAARLYGIGNLSKAHMAKLFRGEVSMQEFTDRMEAIKRIDEFRPAFEEFKQVLKSRGIPTKGIDNDKDVLNFMLGKGPRKFYDIWDEVTVGTAARAAGADVSQATIRNIARRLPGQADELQMQASFSKLAQDFQTIMPLSQAGKYGITKNDLVALEFGGPNQAAIAEKVQMIIKNVQASNAPRVHTVGGQIGTIQQERPQY